MEIPADPYPYHCELPSLALVIIDMQRDFVEPGGFGEALGNDVALLQRAIAPTQRVLAAARQHHMLVLHTREGHRSDLADCPPTKRRRGNLPRGIGDGGPMGRILVRGERGHEIVAALAPLPGEIVVDKPGKGAFFATDLDTILRNRGIESLVVCGVTTEVCVHTTVREANDRGYECLVLADCVASYFPAFHEAALRMIAAQGGILGWVGHSEAFTAALAGTPSVLEGLDPRGASRPRSP